MIHRRKYLIVDAYNVMNDVPEFGKGMKKDLESARENLIHKMIELAHYTKEKVILVFDAYQVKNSVEKVEEREGIQVVFTKYMQTADAYIEELVTRLSEDIRNEIRVVTKDLAEQQIVMGKGAIRVLPMELFYEHARIGQIVQRKYTREEVRDNLENRLSPNAIKVLDKVGKE